MKRKLYMSAPLPFVGQKRMFAREFIKVLEQFKDCTVFVDLFGGSGLLSHITKRMRPDAKVVYNDFDNYRKRLENIPRTNLLLADFRRLAEGVPRHKPITGDARERILERIAQEEKECGYVDYITISSSLMFSMKYRMSLDGIRKEVLYNNIRKADYALCDDYLEGLEITGRDYREVFNEYKDMPNVVFLVDPPYLCTDVTTYSMYWRLSDYLDVLTVLNGHSFVYFTSNKSSIVELCQWMGRNRTMGDPFEGCVKSEFNAHMNYNAGYTDMMLYKHRNGPRTNSAA
ncbi:DNA adenine methylase [uncultured Coprobacter sp.]|uniref:DNA adenine methylase n=1 Tax=uncultured Coprobacter sp. TaxID=1720550 RepID=UPI00263967A1|nr:DNA adenine methylase [uncultured Coprobacter sp.]